MPAVEATDASVSLLTGRCFGRLIQKSSDQMPKRMTTESVPTKLHHVCPEHNCSQPHTIAPRARNRIGKPQRAPDIKGQKPKKNEGQVKKVTMHILHNERKIALAQIALARFAHRAGQRIGPKRLVIRAA